MQSDYALSCRVSAQAPDPCRATSDESLIHSIARGDRRAMQVLFARHNVRVYRFVMRLMGDAALAEDLVSEVFLEVWRKAGRFEGRSQASTWLLAIARYKAISQVRNRSVNQLDEQMAQTIEDPSDNPEEIMAKRDRGAMIASAWSNCRRRTGRSSISSIIMRSRCRRSHTLCRSRKRRCARACSMRASS